MRRRSHLPAVASGERVLAHAATTNGAIVGGTRDALYLPGRVPPRVPWEEIATAEWDTDDRVLRVVETGTYGEPLAEHRLALVDPDRLLSLVRERVTASIVLQRRVAVRGRLGVRIFGRRAPGVHGEISWFVDYDAGLEPADPEVAAIVDAALLAARGDVGE